MSSSPTDVELALKRFELDFIQTQLSEIGGSSVAVVLVPEDTTIEIPSGVRQDRSVPGGVTFAWRVIVIPTDPVDHYELHLSADNFFPVDTTAVLTTKDAFFTFDGLQQGAQVFFKLRTVTLSGKASSFTLAFDTSTGQATAADLFVSAATSFGSEEIFPNITIECNQIPGGAPQIFPIVARIGAAPIEVLGGNVVLTSTTIQILFVETVYVAPSDAFHPKLALKIDLLRSGPDGEVELDSIIYDVQSDVTDTRAAFSAFTTPDVPSFPGNYTYSLRYTAEGDIRDNANNPNRQLILTIQRQTIEVVEFRR